MEKIIEQKITTINKEITKKISNLADAKADRIEIYGINKDDNAATCRLYVKDKLIASKRVYALDKLPCEAITEKEMEILFPVLSELEGEPEEPQ